MMEYPTGITNILRRTSHRWRERLQQQRPTRQFPADYDAHIQEIFLDTDRPVAFRFEQLFRYFVTGFLHYCTPYFSRATYPGAPSNNGYHLDSLESFSRIAPMMAAWVQSGRDPMIQSLAGGAAMDLCHVLRQGLAHGTDPQSKGFWGAIGDYDGSIVEGTDIALTIWLLRDTVWLDFSPQQRDHITQWLYSISQRQVYDNNWHLFPVLVNQVLRSLGHQTTATEHHYTRLKSFYRGNGWFSDGPGQVYDYYNAWGIHYALFWINQVNPVYDNGFIEAALDEFVANYKYFFSPVGYPITGRSICYRGGAVAPLVMAAIRSSSSLSPGMAQRALDCTWRHFVARGALREGTLTQGYWQDDLRFLDTYSGPGSPLWSLRSLIPAFFAAVDAPFWQASAEPLPVEERSYTIAIPAVRWEIHGDHVTQDVRLIKQDNSGNVWRKPAPITLTDRIWSFASGGARRPQNYYLKYELAEYSVLKPFCVVEANSDSDSSL